MSRTSLTKYARTFNDPDEEGAKKLAARKWHEDGSIILLPGSIQRLDPLDRDLVNAIAAKLYGKREAK